MYKKNFIAICLVFLLSSLSVLNTQAAYPIYSIDDYKTVITQVNETYHRNFAITYTPS